MRPRHLLPLMAQMVVQLGVGGAQRPVSMRRCQVPSGATGSGRTAAARPLKPCGLGMPVCLTLGFSTPVELAKSEAGMLFASFLSAVLDTTVLTSSAIRLLMCLARSPSQFATLARKSA